jgi:hypothetical protein
MHIRNYRFFLQALCLFLPFFLFSCQDRKAQEIVDLSIHKHGGEAYKSFYLQFDFRDRRYTTMRNDGIFRYTREFTDSTGSTKDVLNNSGLTRYRNNEIFQLPEDRTRAFTNSVNSVIYFALLPFGLNDRAVNKEWIEETVIKGEPYNLVRVTFDKQGGGEGHQDIFLYWFHKKNHTMDYLAYSYEDDKKGLRFREAVNPRRVGGILFQDYVNHKPQDETIPIEELQKMFLNGDLQKLSEINLENIKVSEVSEQE